jgi:peptide/nickel transport system permease protein
LVGRVLLLLPTLIGITLVVFISVHLLPGDVVDQILGDSSTASPALKAQLRKQYSLNSNVAKQYVVWSSDLLHGDMGKSIISGRPVVSDLKQRLPVTFELGAISLVVSLLVALPIGVLSAMKQDSLWDHIARSFSIAFLAIPSFWLALIVITYGFQWFKWTPPLHYNAIQDNLVANIKSVWVPALILGAGLSGGVTRFTRSMMLEVLRQDYVRTAHAKGLSQQVVVTRHSLRNALIPIITVVGLQVPVLVGGTVILERVFSIPGMGSLLLDSVSHRDYPLVQAIVLISAAVVILSNLTVDLTYFLIDPRMRAK